jgi:leader peptidase (prepilin peptidase)/N-methyltransferase
MLTKHHPHEMRAASQENPIKLAVLKQHMPFAICAAAACAISLYVAPGPIGVCGALLAIIMSAIADRDAHDFIIPDQYSAAACVLGLAVAIYSGEGEALPAFLAALARSAVLASAFLALRLVYYRFRGRHGLGLGDVKLAGVAGAWLDWTMLPLVVEIAAFSALTVVLITQLIARRPIKTTTRLPFGLFFAPSIWIAWLLQTALPWP